MRPIDGMIDTLAISPSNVVRSSCARMACCMCAHHLRSICLCVLTVTTGRARGSAGAVLITNLGQPCSAKQPPASRAVLYFNRGKPRQRRQRWRGGPLRRGWFVARPTEGPKGESSLTLANGIVPCPEGMASMESRRSEWYVWLHKARRDDGHRQPCSGAESVHPPFCSSGEFVQNLWGDGQVVTRVWQAARRAWRLFAGTCRTRARTCRSAHAAACTARRRVATHHVQRWYVLRSRSWP